MNWFERIGTMLLATLLFAFLTLTIISLLPNRLFVKSESRPLLTWNDLKEKHIADGYRIVHEPHLPGPYKIEGRITSNRGDRGRGGGWENKKSKVRFQFTAPENGYQLAVGLETEDGQMTVAIFEFQK
jgi:hypothetical protein